jgi:hypothetical protein
MRLAETRRTSNNKIIKKFLLLAFCKINLMLTNAALL